MRLMNRSVLAVICICLISAAQESTAEKPAMELGGLVTVDYYSSSHDMEHPSLTIGEVDLGANVNISDEIIATILIKAEEDLAALWIDQAFVSFKPMPELELLFGQHIFKHGLLGTQMISYPLYLSDDDEVFYTIQMIRPGLTGSYTLGAFTPSLCFTALPTDVDTSVAIKEVWDPAAVLSLDFAPNEESVVRLASLMYARALDVDLAAALVFGSFSIDAEGFARFTADTLAADQSGVSAGLAWSFLDRYSAAARYDGLSNSGMFKDLGMRVGLGLSVDIKDGIYAAAEFGHVMPSVGKAYQEVMLEIGLEQTIKLPGFQRKTLSTD